MIRLNYTLWILATLMAVSGYAQNSATITIDPADTDITISKHIYGHFSEHLGRCIYDGFYVGEDNTEIPNTEGVRNDIVAALKELQIPNLRWPGGCFADTYHWKDGIGPKDQRPTIVNRWWGGTTEDNSFGTHDFLNMCELLDTEPYLSGNVGSGTVQELIDWVQYTNHDGVSPMADLRRENGREEPWKVKYWGVGNETWGCGGNMTADFYANIYRQYATFLPGWSGDLKIQRIASGASSSDYNWTETLMKNVPAHLMEAVALHHYSVIRWGEYGSKGPSVNYDEQQYFIVMSKALEMEELINKHVEIMDKYDPEKKVDLYVDEWGGWYDTEEEFQNGVLYQQSTMRDAMIAGATLNIFNNHADRVKMANIAQAVNVLQAVVLTDGTKMILTPTYHVMNMYKVHQDAQLLKTTVENVDYALGEDSMPAITASASVAADGKKHLSVTNVDYTKAYTVTINGITAKKVVGQLIDSANAQDYNDFDDPEKITIEEFKGIKNKKGVLQIEIPAHSVVMLEW